MCQYLAVGGDGHFFEAGCFFFTFKAQVLRILTFFQALILSGIPQAFKALEGGGGNAI